MDETNRSRPSSAASSVVSTEGMRMRGIRRFRTASALATTFRRRDMEHDPWMKTSERPQGFKKLEELNQEDEDEEEVRRTLFMPNKNLATPKKKEHMEKRAAFRCRRDPSTGYSEVEFTGESGIKRYEYKPKRIEVVMGTSKLTMYVCQGYFAHKKEDEEMAMSAKKKGKRPSRPTSAFNY